MEIVEKRKDKPWTFGELKVGDCFYWDESNHDPSYGDFKRKKFCIKTSKQTEEVNAFIISDAKLVKFEKDTVVKRCEATITITSVQQYVGYESEVTE